jgi:hypothetical protein
MGLLDRFKDKAGELVQGAKDSVSDVTGIDTDKLVDAAGSVSDAAGSLSDAVESIKDGKLPG